MVNALFRRTFDKPYGRKMMELFVTRQDSDIRNIETGVIAALQNVLVKVFRVLLALFACVKQPYCWSVALVCYAFDVNISIS